jgi:hypothetical protein
MSVLQASFRAIPFHVESATLEQQWHYQTSEFITDHDPITVRYRKAPQELIIDGIVLGRTALITRDLLAHACDRNDPGILIHPLFGMRSVICVARSFETLGQASNAFRFSLRMIDMPGAVGAVGAVAVAISVIERAHNAVLGLGVWFTAAMAPVVASLYALQRAAEVLVKLDGLVRLYSPHTLLRTVTGSVHTAIDAATDLLRTPAQLFSVLASAAKMLVRDPKAAWTIIENMAPLPAEEEHAPLINTLPFLLIAHLSAEGPLPGEFKAPLTALLKVTTDPHLYAFLWDQQLALSPVPPVHRTGALAPSLVAAYQRYGDLTKAEELAHDARQPFAV